MIYRVTGFDHENGTAIEKPFKLNSLFKYFKPYRFKRNIKEINNIITLDTETTTEYQNNDPVNYPEPIRGYINNWSVTIDGNTFHGESVKDLLAFINQMSIIVKKQDFNMIIPKTKKLAKQGELELTQPLMRIYIHNLGYDWTYLSVFYRKFTTFGQERTSPINVLLESKFIKFCDSLKLFDKSLDSVIKDYSLPFFDYKNFWDYSKIRKPGDPLTDKELYYVSSDTLALHDALKLKVSTDDYKNNLAKLPLTKTGEVREKIKAIGTKKYAYESNQKRFKKYFEKSAILSSIPKNFKYRFVLLKDGSVYEYQKRYNKYTRMNQWRYDCLLMNGARHLMGKFLYKKIYMYSQEAFAGGFTHANRHSLGKIVSNVCSGDECSAYPAMTLKPEFVLSWSKSNIKKLEQMKPNYNYLAVVTLTNLRTTHNKDGHFTTISKHKLLHVDPVTEQEYQNTNIQTDNGRVFKADSITICIYLSELNAIKMFYKWDKLIMHHCYEGEKEYLPLSIILTTDFYYGEKTRLKELGKQLEVTHGINSQEFKQNEINYKFAKQQLNSIYGCLATNMLKYVEYPNDPTLSEEENYALYKAAIDETLNKFYNELHDCKDFIIGPQVTMLNRIAIFSVIDKIGPEYCHYSDTDSVKFSELLVPDWEEKFKTYNKANQKVMKKSIKDNNLNSKAWESKGQIMYPGDIEVDGRYLLFKTVGAKAYAYTEIDKKTGKEELHVTIAGLPKKNGANYLLDKDKDNKPRVKNFTAALRRLRDGMFVDEKTSGKKVHRYFLKDESIESKDGIIYGSFIEIRPSTFEKSLANDVVNQIKANCRISQHKLDHLTELEGDVCDDEL